MGEKYCPAGGIECAMLDWRPVCNGVDVWATDHECIRPSRQQPIPAKEDGNFSARSYEEEIAAEIADMPDAEFKANCEKLKKYLEKKVGDILNPQRYDEMESAKQIYLAGCKAQAEKDRETVRINQPYFTLNMIYAALKAAEIKEV